MGRGTDLVPSEVFSWVEGCHGRNLGSELNAWTRQEDISLIWPEDFKHGSSSAVGAEGSSPSFSPLFQEKHLNLALENTVSRMGTWLKNL